MSIPKILHYCWFGNKEPSRTVQRYIENWKGLCPDYEIICWDKNNSPIADNLYASQAYEAEQWAFVSDYVRLKALYEYGGIYLDTDVELLKPFDCFLDEPAFIGFEARDRLGTAVIGAQKGAPWIKEILGSYENRVFLLDDGQDTRTNVEWITTQMVQNYALRLDGSKQTWNDKVSVYPAMLFSPKDYQTGALHIFPETVAIHHYLGSWLPPRQKLRHKLFVTICFLFGARIGQQIKRIVRREEDGK